MDSFLTLLWSFFFLGRDLGTASVLELASISTQPVAELSILAFGDLMLDRDVEKQMYLHGSDYPFREIFGEQGLDAESFDILTANLEGPIVWAEPRHDLFPQFAFDPVVVPKLLKDYSFDLLTLANNHTWDHGLRGWESTLDAIHSAGIATVGHPQNRFEGDIYETEINGISVAFMGITDVLKAFPVNWKAAKQKIQELDERHDFVILSIHWGKEYETESNLYQQDKAHGLVEAGVDLIIGHHPHVIQEVEYYQGVPIYYSLGNFIFDQYFSEAVQEGLALDIRLQKDGDIIIDEILFDIDKGQAKLRNQDLHS